jgi:hypothetical protein
MVQLKDMVLKLSGMLRQGLPKRGAAAEGSDDVPVPQRVLLSGRGAGQHGGAPGNVPELEFDYGGWL